MPKLRDTQTGSVVNIDEALAEKLGPQYVPVEQEKKRGRPRKTEE